ncbi:MAG: alanine racemase [Clostridia bacterium]|nr:alanine racemase [Clostridia bacterium]
MKEIYRDTRLVIDLSILANNVKLIRDMVGDKVAIACVVKANAYGHGAVEIAKTLMDAGADMLTVATLSEGVDLRKEHPEYPILIMGHTPDQYLEYVVKYDLIPTIFTLEQAELLNALAEKAGKPVKVHIKLDTGFHRLGFDARAMEETVGEIVKISKLSNLELEGMFTHLALAGDEENQRQMDLLFEARDQLKAKGISFKYMHAADSIATVDNPEYRLDMVRVGALVYGMRGFHKGFLPVEQALTFKTRISQLHHLKAGEGLSYDYLWKAPKDSVIATLPFGYADGYPRDMRDKGYVSIKGVKCPLVGVLCMDQLMADVSQVEGVKAGDEAVIYGSGPNEMTIEEAAKLVGSNKNEIIARLMERPARVYINGEL